MGFVKKQSVVSYPMFRTTVNVILAVQLRHGLQSMGQYTNPVC